MRFCATFSTVHVSVCSQCDFPLTSLSSLPLRPFNMYVRHGSISLRECSNIVHTSFDSGSQDGQLSFALLENRHHLNRPFLILCIKRKDGKEKKRWKMKENKRKEKREKPSFSLAMVTALSNSTDGHRCIVFN